MPIKWPIEKEHLDIFLDEFELLKLEIRLCTDMKLYPLKTSGFKLLNGAGSGLANKLLVGVTQVSKARITTVTMVVSEHVLFKSDKGTVLQHSGIVSKQYALFGSKCLYSL